MAANKIKPVTGYTLEMMADDLGIEANTIKQRLYIANEHPITTKAIWSKKSFEKIKNISRGRPKGHSKKNMLPKGAN